MKKITILLVLCCLTSSLANAQITAIPDANFEQALIDLGIDATGVLDGSVFTNDINTVTSLIVSNKNISDLTGIEDFAALVTLVCNTNQLTSLNVSQNTSLESLLCTANFISSLDLSNNTALTNVSCNNNSLTSLNLPNTTSLQVLDCNANNLTSLNISNNSALFDLNCSTNQLSSLDLSSNTALTSVDASNNQLTSISLINNNLLTSLDLGTNLLSNLDVSSNGVLENLVCNNNQLTNLDVSNNSVLTSILCQNNQLTSLDVKNGNNSQINNISFNASNNPNLLCITVDDVSYSNSTWFNKDPQTIFDLTCTVYVPDDNFEQALIDLGYDSAPLDDFVSKGVIGNITSLNVSSKNIFDFTGIEAFVSLETLTSRDNPISQSITFNISPLTSLKVLDCSNSQLTSLNVSNNTALTNLKCQNNQLTNLVVTQNTALTQLWAHNNQLSNLDVTQNTALSQLYCSTNSLTALDVSQNIVLTELRCHVNQLTSLNTSQNIALTELWCRDNQITSLNLSQNVSLTDLICNNNQLTNLDVRNGNNTNVTTFNATSNINLLCVSVDDVAYSTTNWTNIDTQTSFSVDCSTPQTQILDSNFEQALIDLGIDSAPINGFVPTISINGVLSLNIQNKNISDLTGIEDFTALETLLCNTNQLNSLNISNNLSLITLACYDNLLINLDLSANTLLETIICNNNQLNSLDLTNNPALTNVNCNTNTLTSLDIKNGNNANITNQFFNATNNPNLTCINVDNEAYSNANWLNKDVQTVYSTDCSTLGLNDVKQAIHLTLYPNPATDVLYIKTSQNVQISKVDIYDISGKKIVMSSLSNTINVSRLQTGLYFVSITVNDTEITKKLIIK